MPKKGIFSSSENREVSDTGALIYQEGKGLIAGWEVLVFLIKREKGR